MSEEFAIGLDIRAYTVQGNGTDLFLGVNGPVYGLLAQYKEVELNVTITDSDVTPSSQYLEQNRMTGFSWELTMKHMVQIVGGGGAPPGLDLIFRGNFNLMAIFQLWNDGNGNGPYYTAYGRIRSDSLAAARESMLETLVIKNAGPVGAAPGDIQGSSLFYANGSPLTVSEASVLATNLRQPTFVALHA